MHIAHNPDFCPVDRDSMVNLDTVHIWRGGICCVRWDTPNTPLELWQVGYPNTPLELWQVGYPNTPLELWQVGYPNTPLELWQVGYPNTPLELWQESVCKQFVRGHGVSCSMTYTWSVRHNAEVQTIHLLNRSYTLVSMSSKKLVSSIMVSQPGTWSSYLIKIVLGLWDVQSGRSIRHVAAIFHVSPTTVGNLIRHYMRLQGSLTIAPEPAWLWHCVLTPSLFHNRYLQNG